MCNLAARVASVTMVTVTMASVTMVTVTQPHKNINYTIIVINYKLSNYNYD